MEEVDFYYGLDAFEQQEEKKSKELEDLENKYQKSLKTVKQLEDENKALKKKIQKIEINFQNLLDTARSEIQRKNREIDRLRTEKDDLCFRRISKHQSDSGKSKSDGQIAVKKIEISLNDNTDFVESKKKVSPQKKGKTYQNKDGKRIRSRSRSYSREQSKSSHKRHRSRSRSVEKYNRRKRRSHSFDSIKYNRKGSKQMKCHNKALKSKETSYVHADNNSKDHKEKSGQNKSEHSKNYNYRSEIHESSIKQTERIKKQHDPKQNLKTKKEEKRSELNDFQSFEPDGELIESPSLNSISCEDISGERIFKENCDNQSGKSLTTSSAISSGDHIDVNEQTTYLKIAGFDKNFPKILDASTTSRELSFDTGFVNFKRNTASFKGEKEEEIIEIPGLDLIATNAVISNQSVEENIFAKIADSDSKVSSPTVCHKSGNLLQGLEYSTEHKMPEEVRKIDLRDENVKIGNLKDSHLKNLLGKELTNASSENLLRQNEIRASKGNDQDENEINLKRENSTFLELYNDKSSQILKISRKTAEKAFSGRKTCDKEIPLTSAITKIQNINSKQKENGLIMNEVEQSKRPEQEQLLSKNLEKHNESVTSHKSEEDVNRQKSSFEAKSSKLSTKEKVSLDEDGKTYDNGSSNAKICEIGETILKKVSESCGHMCNNGNSRTSTNVQQEKVLVDQEVSSDVISLQNPNHMAESWQSGQVEPLKENSQTLIEAERIISGQGKKSEDIINQTIFSETICLPASVENDTKSSQEKCGSAALGTIMTSFCTNNLFVGAKEKNSALCQASNSAQICLLPPKNENKSQLISAANIVNDEKGKLKLSVSKEKGENLVGETATPNSDQQIENNCELVERKAGQEKLRLCSLEKKERISNIEKVEDLKGNICSFTNTDVNNKSVKVCSLSGDHKQNMKSVPKAPEEQNRNKNELHITDENLGGADKDFSITLQPILSQESANIPYAMSSDKVLYSKKEEIILRKETKKLEIPVKEVEEFGNSLPSNDLSSQLENLNKTQMAFNAMQIRKETGIDINSADDDKGRIRLITKEIDEENVNKVAQVIKLLPELNVVPKALNNGNNEAVFPKSLHICNSNATITSKSTQLNIVVASLLKSPYCNISNNPQPAKETSPTKPSSEASSRSATASTNSTDVSNKLNKFITDNAHETSVTNALKNSCVVQQLPCITNHSMETSVNFNNVFSKTNQETLTTTTLTSNSLDLVRSINHKSSIKHKEYILPAASVLCNVHNLENATKSTEMTNKSAFSTIATSKQKITEIEDGSDSDRTNKESAERKEISEPFIKSPKKASLTCLENLSNSDLSNGNNDDDNSSIKDLKNDKEIVLKKPPLLGLAPITKAVCYYKQVKRLGKKKFYFRNVQARRTKKFRSVKSKFKPRDGWGIKRRNRNSLPLYAIDVKGAESQESKVFDKYEKNSITSKCLNSSETEKKDQKQACVENLRAEKEMEEKKGIEDETNAARRSSCENEAERLAMNATNSAQESLEISPDSPTIIQSTKAPALNVSQIKNIFLENGDKEEILPGVSKLEEICADEKANNNTFPDKVNKFQTPTAYFAGLDCSKFSDVKCLEKILTANCLKNKSYKIPKLKKSFESLKSVKTNKRKLFSLQDVGIYVGPRKGHLSTFCAPKIKANETIKNHKCLEMTDQEIKKNVENNPREFKATETKKLETDVSKSNVTLAGSEVVRSGLGSDKQTRALKNKETFDETSLDYAFMKASQSGEDRHPQLKDEKTEQISNLNLIENVENTHFAEPSDRDSEQIRINSKEIFSSSSSKKGAEITKASLNHKPWDILMPRSPEIAQKSIVKPLKLLRQPVKNNTPLNERVKVDQSISKLESTFCIEGKQTQKDTDVGRKPKEKVPQESTNCGKSSIDKQKESVAVTPRFSEEKTPEQLNTSSKMFTSSEDISEQRNKINDKIDDMSDNYSQISVGVARHKRRKCVISKRRILDSDSDDEEGYSSKSEGSVSEHCNSSSLTTKFQQKSCPTLKVTQVNKNETNLDGESIQMPNGSFNLPQLNHSIFNGDSVDSTATEVVPIVNSANTSQDEKFKEIDTQLSAIFQSPQYEKDYTINNKTDVNDFKIDNKMEINTSEVIQKESGIKNQENDWASLNVSAAETTQSSLNSSANSVKCLSLGSTEYRFEKVSNNVVNLFISRKRKRKKPTVTDVLTA
ncbi:uncharacterized protein LOC119635742 [Glossina fuscipes]|uniref:Uncharacterized protein LOC119635742 n=1 Tax=Glossina fuscipes TaxID=7396 RepID=A0A8U0WLZ4_9MUSC|nr:uncharacterized protein LOC119635742 [Glossina fuscipes]KAI9583323.1 hypothetical protein GQX74_005071 [Glossina fuscipes]